MIAFHRQNYPAISRPSFKRKRAPSDLTSCATGSASAVPGITSTTHWQSQWHTSVVVVLNTAGFCLFRLVFVLCVLFFVLATGTSADAAEPNFGALDSKGNRNGYLESREIPAHDFAIVARYASLAGLDMKRPLPIRELEKGRQRYISDLDQRYATDSPWRRTARSAEFGRLPGTGVRPFGVAGDIPVELNDSVRWRTIATFQNCDANRDASLSREEAGAAYKSAAWAWFRGDRDDNGLLTFWELATYFAADTERMNISRSRNTSSWDVDGVVVTLAHRRHADWLIQKFDRNKNRTIDRDEVPDSWKTGNGLGWADANGDGQITLLEMQVGAVRFLKENELHDQRLKDADFQNCNVLAADMIRRYDTNKDRALNRYEWRSVGGHLDAADINRNGLIQESELARWLHDQLSQQAGANLPEGVPDWFAEADLDTDRQVLLSEFLSSRTRDQVPEFLKYDQNRDGIVTAEESVSHSAGGKLRFTNRSPLVVEAQSETFSEIHITDDIQIADIDLQVAVLKDGDDDIELRLAGPEGQTATLYYTSRRKAWGGGRMFENTVIDDEAPGKQNATAASSITSSFRPQAMQDENLDSLNVFYGQKARGTWRLLIANKGQNRGNQAGLLEGWSLFIRPTQDGGQK